MKDGSWVTIILAILTLGISITMTLMGIIFTWLKGRIDRNEERIDKDIRELRAHTQARLRSLGHEDREMKGNITDLFKMMVKGKKD